MSKNAEVIGEEIAGKEVPRHDENSSTSKKDFSAFSPSGINKSTYSPNTFDTDMLKSYSNQISEIADKAFSLYKKKMRIKERMTDLKSKFELGQITSEDYDYQTSKLLKNHEEYKVYEMYDEYISYLAGHMRSYCEGIFNYIDSHKYDIPVLSRTEAQSEIEKDYFNSLKNAELEEDEEAAKAGWNTKADEFAKVRGKKKSLMDRMASGITNTLFPSKERKAIMAKLKEQEGEDSKFKIFINWFLGRDTNKVLANGKKVKKESALDKFINNRQNKEDVLGKKTAFSAKFKNVRRIHFEADDEIKKVDTSSNDAKNFVAKLGQKKEKTVSYNATTYTALANILMKDISVEFINSFPAFFKTLYKTLRYANMHVLSSTYTNTMLLTSILAGSGAVFLVGVFSLSAMFPIQVIVANSLLAGILGLAGTVLGFHYFPNYKKKNRERNINTNLPFALDHMAAVASSGVSPSSMFQLISESNDYGEVSVEVEKVVEYVELFGYDIMSAVQRVSTTCPSRLLKEFFEGFVSTVQSGGELKDFLRQSADEAMLHYKLEREKFT
ncbi:MAG: type II secretion system F family protein [Nanoarchaeota archaeon]